MGKKQPCGLIKPYLLRLESSVMTGRAKTSVHRHGSEVKTVSIDVALLE